MALEWLKVFSIRCRVKRCSPSPFTEVTGRRSLRRVGVSGSPNCGQAFRGDWRNPQHNGGWVVGPNSTWKIWVKMEKNIPKIKILYIYIYFVDVISFIHIPTQNTGIKIKDSIWIFCFVDPNQSKQPNKPNTNQTQPNPTKPNPTIKWNKKNNPNGR